MDAPVFRWMPADKWVELVHRAQHQHVVLTPLPRFRKLMRASSASRPGDGYLVDEYACSCPAARSGQHCKHRAAYLHLHFGRLVKEHGFPDWFDMDLVASKLDALDARPRVECDDDLTPVGADSTAAG